MGFLNFIFSKRLRIEHDFFGTMRFHESKKGICESFFECRRHFQPTGKTIEALIDGDETGVTDWEIDFFRSIEENYSAICTSIIPLIEQEAEGIKIRDFRKEFHPVCLTLPRCETDPVTWEIEFESDHDSNHSFFITMSGFEAKEVLIDG